MSATTQFQEVKHHQPFRHPNDSLHPPSLSTFPHHHPKSFKTNTKLNPGASLSKGSTFSVSVTWTVGIDAGITIEEIFSLGLSVSVSKTETEGISEGVSVPSPKGPWNCALAVFPEMLDVKGKKSGTNDMCLGQGYPKPFDVQFPALGDTGAPRSRVEICACSNYPHANDAGAPMQKCNGCAL